MTEMSQISQKKKKKKKSKKCREEENAEMVVDSGPSEIEQSDANKV